MTPIEELSDSGPEILLDPKNDKFVQEFCTEVTGSTWWWIIRVMYVIVVLGLLYFRQPNFYIKAGIFVVSTAVLYFL